MAKPIVINLDGHESCFDLAKLDRAKIYGSKRRIAVGSGDRPCTKAALTVDGLYLIQSGMTAQGYFIENGRWVQKSEMVGLDAGGNPIPLMPSTLGVVQTAAEADPRFLLDHVIEAVYVLQPQMLDPYIQEKLVSGVTLTFPFNYGADYHLETAFLINNPDGYFCLVGNPVITSWCEANIFTAAEDDANEIDDLDFDMF